MPFISREEREREILGNGKNSIWIVVSESEEVEREKQHSIGSLFALLDLFYFH